MPADDPDVTALLLDWEAGDEGALEDLLEQVYTDLRERAAAVLRRERADHTLQPTALVNEAYLRLVDQNRVHWKSRGQFFGVAVRAMRRILVDHARHKHAQKRGAGAVVVPLEEEFAPGIPGVDIDLLALDEALHEFEKIDPRQCRIVELRFFGGLSIEETAEAVGVSKATVKNDWSMARAWLLRRLKES